jgi:hypothetical protein
MKCKWFAVTVVVLLLSSWSVLLAQDTKTKVQAYFDQRSAFIKAKDLEGLMSLQTNDYQDIIIRDREGARNTAKAIFDAVDGVLAASTPLEIRNAGKYLRVLAEEKVSVKVRGEDWKQLPDKWTVSYLVQEGNFLKCARNIEIDKERVKYISGNAYKDEESGLSFVVPEGWEILTGGNPLPGSVSALAPDKTSAAFFIFLKTPGISAQQAVEGDEAVAKSMSKEGGYELYKSRPITVGAFEAYETESRFFIPGAQERYRRRVYFKARGSLYVLCFDAIPSTQWDTVKGSFQQILDSIQITN